MFLGFSLIATNIKKNRRTGKGKKAGGKIKKSQGLPIFENIKKTGPLSFKSVGLRCLPSCQTLRLNNVRLPPLERQEVKEAETFVEMEKHLRFRNLCG